MRHQLPASARSRSACASRVVRCGRCNAVFNALDHLVDDTAPATEPAAAMSPDLAASDPFAFNPPADVEVPPSAAPSRTPTAETPAEDASLEDKLAVELPAEHPPQAPARLGVPSSWSGASPFPLIRAEEDGDHAPPSTIEIVEAVEASGAADDWTDHAGPEPYAAAPAAVAGDGLPFDERETDTDAVAAAPARAPRAWLPRLRLLGVVAVVGAAAQAHISVTALATSRNSGRTTRPWLSAACERLGSRCPLGRDSDLISIDTSEMRPDPARKSGLLLNVTLRNRASFVQEYPRLELTLTDAQDAALLRRVFEPGEFLGRNTDPARGLAAGAELPITLRLDVATPRPAANRVFVYLSLNLPPTGEFHP